MRRPFVAFGLAAALYLLLTTALLWPLPLHAGTAVPNDLGDSLLNMFLLAWDARVMPFTERWWNLPQFYPIPGVMAFSEHLLGLSVITTPVIALTGNALLAYNVAFFVSFPLCALAAHLLVYEITRRHDVSLVAALAYGFAPYRMAQFAHVQVLSAYWIPLAFFALHRFLRTPHWKWAALFALSWLMQALACGYYLFYLSVLVGFWLLWFVVGRLDWRRLGQLAAAWTAAGLALLPVALGYLEFQPAYGLRRWPEEIESFSADIASVLTAPGNLRLWGWLQVVQRPESEFFIGLALPALIVIGAAIAWSAPARDAGKPRRMARILLALAFVIGCVAASPLWLGPWKLTIAGIRLLSVGSPQKPLSLALLLVVAALALHPSIRMAWRRRSPLAFYAIGACAMWMFSLGPAPTLMNEPLLYKAPYSWLMLLPGVEGVRVPARFFVLATFCLAVAGGLGLRRIVERWPAARLWLPAAAAVALLVEAWPQPLTLVAPPSPRPSHTRAVARLDLPFSFGQDLVVLYRAIEHRRPVINGYSGYFAPHYSALRHLLERHDPAVLALLASYGPVEVVVDHEHDGDGRWRQYIRQQPNAELVHQETDYTSFRLAKTDASLGPSHATLAGQPLAVAGITASRYQDRVGEMVDNDRITRWDTGQGQDPTNVVTVDLGTMRHVDGVEMQIAGFVADFPRELAIDLSEDGTSWRQAWNGAGGLPALAAALTDPLNVPLRFPLDGSRARYVRMRQLGADPVFYWTIAELRIHGR